MGLQGQEGWLTEKLAPPAAPVRLLMPLRVTRLAICLQARAMELMTVASSLSMLPACSSCACRQDLSLQPHGRSYWKAAQQALARNSQVVRVDSWYSLCGACLGGASSVAACTASDLSQLHLQAAGPKDMAHT